MSKTSNPQKRRRSSQNRPVFFPNLAAGGTGIDLVSGVVPVTSISGTRYGIVNNTVTQFAVNQPPIEDDGLRGCPAFTQLAKQSETLTGSAWTKENLLTPTVYGSFQNNYVWSAIENTESTFHAIYQSSFDIIEDNSVCGLCFIAKYNGRKLLIDVRTKSNTYFGGRINLQTGTFEASSGAVASSIVDIGNGYYRVFVAYNLESGSTTPFTRIYLYNDASQYTGDGISGVYLGQPTFINFGVNGIPFIPPYIPNNTSGLISVVSEAATSTTGSIFDLDDTKLARLKDALIGPNAQGHLELIVKSNVDSAWWANNSVYNILSVNNTSESLIYINKDSGGAVTLRTTDGTNVASVTQGLTVGSTYKISIDWGTHPTGQKMVITVNGVKSTLSVFAGWGDNDLMFFFGNAIHAGWIVKDSLKVMDRPQW